MPFIYAFHRDSSRFVLRRAIGRNRSDDVAERNAADEFAPS